MKASEVIKSLEELISQHGDLETEYYDDISTSDIGKISYDEKTNSFIID